ncbi:MAG: hypothetical protein U0807_18640 [Candidatus Binatia bacterium]
MRWGWIICLALVGPATPSLAQFPGASDLRRALGATQPGTHGSGSVKGFSGQSAEYADSYNGFRLRVPAEFTLHAKGATTDWQTAPMDGMSAGIYVNTTDMPGVSSQVLYNTNLKSYQQKRDYTDVQPVKVKFGDKTALAFRVKEADHQAGSPERKNAGDHHRWHLFVFAQNRFYTWGFTGAFASFEAGRLQPTFEEVIQSVEVIPVH